MTHGFNEKKEKVEVYAKSEAIGGQIVTLTKTVNVASETTGQANFDSYTIPDGFSDYVVLEASQNFQNQKWVGGQYTGGLTAVYPWCTIEKSGSILSAKMGLYNPVTQGAIDITATIKLLLIP